MFNRRQLLLGSAALAGSQHLSFGQGGGNAFADYKALVCVFLFGGNDSFNMLVPRSNAEYNVYAASRQNLAIPQSDLLPISPITSDGALYGLHPSLAGVQQLFESGRAAFVANVGPLVEPTTRDQFSSGGVTLPPQLFSHNDMQDQWHTLKGAARVDTGWAGRIADLIRTHVAAQTLSTNVSLSGTAPYQAAAEATPYVMGPDGVAGFAGFDESGIFLEQRHAFERIVNADYVSVYQRGFAEVQRRALATADIVSDALAAAPAISTAFPSSQLGTQLRTVARLIAARDELKMQRQVFFVATGGFDSHDNQNADQPGLLQNVSDALKAFHDATTELGIAESVTAFTQSDFGRTLTSNGDGSDHAWGGVQIVSGGSVYGRDIYGSYPLLDIGGVQDVGGGRMIPTTSADQYAATLSKWFGIDDADLAHVAPNIGNFPVRDLGFLA